MKALSYISGFTFIILKALLLVGKLALLLPSAFIKKQRSKMYFIKALSNYGVPPDDAQKLTRSYMNIVSHDILSNIRHSENKKTG